MAAAVHNGVLLLSTRTHAPLGLVPLPARPTALSFTPDGMLLAAGLADGSVHVIAVGEIPLLNSYVPPLSPTDCSCLIRKKSDAIT